MNDISKIISSFFLSLSIFFLCYVVYRSQVFHSGSLFDYYLKFYIIAFSFIVISFVSFFIPRKLKINITIFFISILIGLYLVEGYLNIKPSKFSTYKTKTGKEYDKRTTFEVFQDLRNEDPSVVVSISPVNFNDKLNSKYSPLSGIANRKTIHCNENGYYSIYQSDRYGFNNPDKEWDKIDIEFFIVGDSVARGACVNEPDTISGNFRKLKNNQKGVLNLGQSGNGPLREYATLREYLPLKNVTRVLWLYFEGNDLRELNGELKHRVLVSYLKDKNFSQYLSSNRDEIQRLLLLKLDHEEERLKQSSIFENKIKRNSLTSFLILTKVRISFSESFFSNKYTFQKKEFENILKLSNELSKKNNSKLYFIYLPTYARYKLNNNNENFQNYKKVTEIVESLNIPIIDINKELFSKHSDPMSLFPFREQGHYNVRGYQLIAKIIFNKIKILEK